MTEQFKRNNPYRLLQFLSQQPIQLSRFFARALAGFVNLLKVSKTSENIRLNLKIALPELGDAEREKITRAAIRNELTSYFEFFNIWGTDNQQNIARIENIFGEALIHEALQENKGLVLIVPHFGTWEIMNAYLAQFTQMTIMYKPVKNAAVNQFVLAARSREQANLVPTDERGVRQIFKALKTGGTTVILPDHSPHHSSELIPYFGIPLSSSNLSAKLIQKTKAKALLLYAMRNKNGHFDMHVEAMDDAIYEGTANDATEIIHQHLEQLIRRYPEHYHWSYKRFRAHPKLRRIYNQSPEKSLMQIQAVREEYQSSFID